MNTRLLSTAKAGLFMGLPILTAGTTVTYAADDVAPTSLNIIEEVQVTARRREESIQDVPSSVTAFSGDYLLDQNITSIEDVFGRVPGLYFTQNSLGPVKGLRQLVIRGVGSESQLEPSVAVFVDGVYAPSLAFDHGFFDLERVEVLKGPQGSLFGRNTEGGVLNVVTRKPDEELQARLTTTIDEFDTYLASGSVSGPLSEQNQLFGRVGAFYSQTDGFITNNSAVAGDPVVNATDTPFTREFGHNSQSRKNADESKDYIFSGALRWLPTDNFEVNFSMDYAKFEGGDQAPGPLLSCECYEVNGDNLFDQETDNFGASITLDWEIPLGTLTSITGYRDISQSTPFDFDGVDFRVNNIHDFDFDQDIRSQEFRLAGDNERLSWVTGLYYFEEKNSSDRWYNFPNVDDPNGAPPQGDFDGLWNQQIVDIDRTGAAAFGQVSVYLTEKWELTLGGRYSWEEAKVSALAAYAIPGDNFGIPVDATSLNQADPWPDFVTPVKDSESWTDFSPTASVKYNFTDDFMTYLTYAQGFKAGSYQKAPVTPSDVYAIDPEKVDSYELGFKSTLLDGSLQWNAAAFYIELSDMQLQSVEVINGLPVSTINNASSAESKGVEMSIVYRPFTSLTLSLDYGYTDTELTDFFIADFNTGEPFDASGLSFPNTPKHTGFISAEYTYPINNAFDLVSSVSYRYVDDIVVELPRTSADTGIPLDSWEQIDARIALYSDNWRISLFAENLTDEYIVLSAWDPFFIEPAGEYVKARVAAPRRVGLSVTYDF